MSETCVDCELTIEVGPVVAGPRHANWSDCVTLLKAALARAEREREQAVEAAKAFSDLATCYRLGTQPTEKLHERLDRAREVVERNR